jgi:hypothetical protein
MFGDREEGTTDLLEAVKKKSFVGGSSAGKIII